MEDPKSIAVLKNSMSEQEMNESGEHWTNHQGPYMTVAETLAYAAKRDKAPVVSKTSNIIGDEITFGEEVKCIELIRESDDKTVRDLYEGQLDDHNDYAVRSRESTTLDERTSDREHHHH